MTQYQITVAKYNHEGKPRFHFRTDWMDEKAEFKAALDSLRRLPADEFKISYYIKDVSTHFYEVESVSSTNNPRPLVIE